MEVHGRLLRERVAAWPLRVCGRVFVLLFAVWCGVKIVCTFCVCVFVVGARVLCRLVSGCAVTAGVEVEREREV